MIIRGWQKSQKLVEYQRSWSHSHGKRLVKILIKDIKILPHPFVYNHPYRHQNLHHWFIIPKTPIITREPWEETFATSTWSEKISTRNRHQYLLSTRSVTISNDNCWFNLDVKIVNRLHQLFNEMSKFPVCWVRRLPAEIGTSRFFALDVSCF